MCATNTFGQYMYYEHFVHKTNCNTLEMKNNLSRTQSNRKSRKEKEERKWKKDRMKGERIESNLKEQNNYKHSNLKLNCECLTHRYNEMKWNRDNISEICLFVWYLCFELNAKI